MIQDDGIVSTGAGTHSPHPLQVTAKSQKRAGGSPNTESSIGEEKAKCPGLSRSAFGTWLVPPGVNLRKAIFDPVQPWLT